MIRSSFRTATSKLTALGAVIGAAALMVSSTLPAAAINQPDRTSVAAQTADVRVQSFTMASAAFTPVAPRDRDGYTVTLPPPPPPVRVQVRAAQIRNFAPSGGYIYSVNPGGTIRWPFPKYVPIASGFGSRPAPCSGCSSYHDGLDFLPGGGAPIGAIADGVVATVQGSRGGYGTHVTVTHQIKGQTVVSYYAHMIAGSPTVSVGQAVTVGQTLGLVGNTGASTGSHLHLGITINGTFVDPYAWMLANAD